MISVPNPTLKTDIETIIAAIVEKAKQDPHVDAIYLFGSYAKGTSTICSDIDFAFVSNVPEKINRSMLRYAADAFDIDCDFVYTTHDKLSAAVSALDVNFHIRNEGVLLWQR